MVDIGIRKSHGEVPRGPDNVDVGDVYCSGLIDARREGLGSSLGKSLLNAGEGDWGKVLRFGKLSNRRDESATEDVQGLEL